VDVLEGGGERFAVISPWISFGWNRDWDGG
jgi:hypothetical protein